LFVPCITINQFLSCFLLTLFLPGVILNMKLKMFFFYIFFLLM
jgi:hypothetical protein